MFCDAILSFTITYEKTRKFFSEYISKTKFSKLFQLFSILFSAYLLVLMFSLLYTYPLITFGVLFILYYLKPFCKKSIKDYTEIVKNNISDYNFFHLIVFILIAAPLLFFATSIFIGIVVE
jgi:hypothetical protein